MHARLEAYAFRPRLRDLGMPCLFLAGEHDPLLKTAGVLGWPTLDRPEAIAEAVAEFINSRSKE